MIEYVFSTQVYTNAVNVILVYIKTLKYVRINDRLNILTRTFAVCQNNIISILVLWVFIHTGFSLTAQQIFGSVLQPYSNFNTSFSTLLFALLGNSDVGSLIRVEPNLTHIFFWTFYIFENLMLLNFFVAILSGGFATVSHSVALAPLDVAILRYIDEILYMCRWKYIRERLIRTLTSNATRFELLIEVKLCLVQHLQLALRAASDLNRIQTHHHRDHIPMTFRDLQWWLPAPLFEALGMHYLLALWEDIVFEYHNVSSKSQRTIKISELGNAVSEGVKCQTDKSNPDTVLLELQCESLSSKLSQLPYLLCKFDVVKRLSVKHSKEVGPKVRAQRMAAAEPTREDTEMMSRKVNERHSFAGNAQYSLTVESPPAGRDRSSFSSKRNSTASSASSDDDDDEEEEEEEFSASRGDSTGIKSYVAFASGSFER